MSAGVEIACRVYKPPHSVSCRRHRPETTALYEVVRDNLETLYGASGDGAIAVRIPKHAPQGALGLPARVSQRPLVWTQRTFNWIHRDKCYFVGRVAKNVWSRWLQT